MTREVNSEGFVRVMSGINGLEFDRGFNRITRIFDKTKTRLSDPDRIFCFTSIIDLKSLNLDDELVKAMLDYTLPYGIWPRGKRLIMSGLTDKDNLAAGNFSYCIGPILHVDTLFEYRKKAFSSPRMVNISF